MCRCKSASAEVRGLNGLTCGELIDAELREKTKIWLTLAENSVYLQLCAGKSASYDPSSRLSDVLMTLRSLRPCAGNDPAYSRVIP